MGYAFVDLSTPTEADRAIAELSGKDILERKVSVQLARTPQPAGEKSDGAANGESGAEGSRRRASGRGRGRGRGRAGRAGRGGRSVCISSSGIGIFLTYGHLNANLFFLFRRAMMHLLLREPQRLPPLLTLRFYH